MGKFSQSVNMDGYHDEEERSGLSHVSNRYGSFTDNNNTCIYNIYIDTKASEKTSALISRKAFCSDVTKLSPIHQTSCLEAYQCCDTLRSQIYCIYILGNVGKVRT